MTRGESMPYVALLSRPRTTSAASGWSIVSWMWAGSTTSTDLTDLGREPHEGQMLFGSKIRSRLALTDVASNGVPSVKLTPERSVNVHIMASDDSCQAVASDGWTLPLW